MKLISHIKDAMEALARMPCYRRNCGQVCKCGPCHARIVLSRWDEVEHQFARTPRRARVRLKGA